MHPRALLHPDHDVPGEVTKAMSAFVTPIGVERWWHTPIEALGEMTPKEAWACDEGCRDDVRALIRSYADPSFT